jgi:hypothetical protein
MPRLGRNHSFEDELVPGGNLAGSSETEGRQTTPDRVERQLAP